MNIIAQFIGNLTRDGSLRLETCDDIKLYPQGIFIHISAVFTCLGKLLPKSRGEFMGERVIRKGICLAGVKGDVTPIVESIPEGFERYLMRFLADFCRLSMRFIPPCK